jgi:uncharacterized membrane protein
VAAKEILTVEPGGFAMLVVSLVVLVLGVPVAARLGRHDTAVFKRTSVLWGALMLGILFAAVFVIGLAESH